MRIYLLRHGEIEMQGEKRMIGQIDLPLSEKGIQQAVWWQKELADVDFEQIYCSDLSRTYQTAQIIAGENQIHVMPEFREVNVGEWDGAVKSELCARFPEQWEQRRSNIVTYRPPGGENFIDLYERIIPAFEKIVKSSAPLENSSSKAKILIVAHSCVNRIILCHVLGMPLTNIFQLEQDYSALNIIDVHTDFYQVVSVNISPEI